MGTLIVNQYLNRQFFLDTFPGAAAAYSLRQLNSTTTPVIRVRRSSDNLEQDFTASEVENGALTTWVGTGNDGFVKTWYDQSGNNNHAGQLTTTKQPRIVDSGSLILENNKPAILFSPSNEQEFLFTEVNLLKSYYVMGVCSANVPTCILIGHDTLTSNINFDSYKLTINASGTFKITSLTTTQGAQNILSINRGGSTSFEAFLNGNSEFASFSANNDQPLSVIGHRTNLISQYYWDGSMQEIILYGFEQSISAKSSIETNANNYYNVF